MKYEPILDPGDDVNYLLNGKAHKGEIISVNFMSETETYYVIETEFNGEFIYEEEYLEELIDDFKIYNLEG